MVTIEISSIKRQSGCTEVEWSLNGRNQVSHFYRHADGSTGFDPYFIRHSLSIQAVVYGLVNDSSLPKHGKRTATLN